MVGSDPGKNSPLGFGCSVSHGRKGRPRGVGVPGDTRRRRRGRRIPGRLASRAAATAAQSSPSPRERERERTGAGRECSAHAGGDGIGGGKERKGCSSRRNNYYFTIFSFHYVLLCHLISVPKTCEVMPVYNL